MSLKTILKNFLNHVDSLEAQKKSGTDPYEIDFQKLKGLTEQLKHDKDYATTQGLREVNRRKNRYKDILPYDYTRVVLSDYPGVPGSDYINANYIKGASGSLAYIASQGPLPNTVVDFWRMIWECEVQVVVMACNEQESGKYKCECYWPGDEEQKQYGNINVEMVKWRQVCPDFLVRTLKACWEKEERVICQFHYTTWPDHGVPNSVQPILELVRLVRDCQASEAVPVLVHCSAGCGRTGTICAIDFVWGLMRMGKLTKSFNLFNVISDMRRQRIAMVQTKEQYVLVHKAVSSLFEQQLRVIDSHTYENLNEDGEPLIFKEMEEEEEGIYEDILECRPEEDSFTKASKDTCEHSMGFQEFQTESSITCNPENPWTPLKCEELEKCIEASMNANKSMDSFLCCNAERLLSENCVSSPLDVSNSDLKSSEKSVSGYAECDAEAAAAHNRNSKILLKLRQEEGVKRLITGWNKAVEQSDCCRKFEKCDQITGKKVTEKEMASPEQIPPANKCSKLKVPVKLESFSSSEFQNDALHNADALRCNERNHAGNGSPSWAMSENASFGSTNDSSEKLPPACTNSRNVATDDSSHHPGKLVGKATVIRRPSIAKLKAFFEKSPADCDTPSEDTSRRRRPLFRSHSHYVGHSRTFSISDSLNQRTETSSNNDFVPDSECHFAPPPRIQDGNREDLSRVCSPSSQKETTSPLSSANALDNNNVKSLQGTVQDRACAFRKNGENTGINRIYSCHASLASGNNLPSGIMEAKYSNAPGSPTKKKCPKSFDETVGVADYLSGNTESATDIQPSDSKPTGHVANIGDESKSLVGNIKPITPVQMRIKQFLPPKSDLEVPPDLPVKKKVAAGNYLVQTAYEGGDTPARLPSKNVACNLSDFKTCSTRNYNHTTKSVSGVRKSDCNINSSDKPDGQNASRDMGNDHSKCTSPSDSCFKVENDHQTFYTKNLIKKENVEHNSRTMKNNEKDKNREVCNAGERSFASNISRSIPVNSVPTKMSSPVGKSAHNAESHNIDETKYMNVNSLAQKNIQQIENKLKCHPRGAIIDLTSRKSYIDELQGSCDRQSANEPVKLFQKVESYKVKSPEKTNFSQDNVALLPKVDNSSQCKASPCSPSTKIPCLQGNKDSASKKEVQVGSSKSSTCTETVPKRVEPSHSQQTSINLLLHSPPPKTKKTHSSKPSPIATSPVSPKEPVYGEIPAQKSAKDSSSVPDGRARENFSPPGSSQSSKIAVSSSQSPVSSGSATSRSDLRYFPVARQTVRNVKVVANSSQKTEHGVVQNTQDFNHHQAHPPSSETKAENHKGSENYCVGLSDGFHETTEHSKIPQKAIPVSYDVHQLSGNKSLHEKESSCNLQRSVSGPQIIHPGSKATIMKSLLSDDKKQPIDHYAVPHRDGYSAPQNQQQISESYNHPYYGKLYCNNEGHGLQISPFPPGPPKPPRTYYYDYRNAQERGATSASRDIYSNVQTSGAKDRGRYLVSVASPKHTVPKSSQQITETRTPDYRCYPNTVLKPADRRHNAYYSPQFQEPGTFSSTRNEIYMSHSYPSASYCDSRQTLQPTRNQYYSETLSHGNVRTDPGVHPSVSICRSDDEKLRSANRSFSSSTKNRSTFSDYENVYDAQNDYLCAVANNGVEDDSKHGRGTTRALQCSQSDVSVYAALHFQKPHFPPSISHAPQYNIPESTNVGTLSRRPIFDTLQRRNKLQVSWEQRRSHDDMDIRPAPSARLKEQIHARRSMVELDNLGISVAADKGSPEEDLLPHLISPKHEFAQDAVGDYGGRPCLPVQKVKIPVEMADTLFSKVPDVPHKRCHAHSKETGSFGGTLSKAFGKLTSLTKFSAKDSSINQFSPDSNSNTAKGVTTKTKEKDKSNYNFPNRSPKKSKDSQDPQEQWTQV